MIDLKEYFYQKRISPYKFAKEHHISKTTMFNWLNGIWRPSFHMACLIEKATNGEVTVEQLRGKDGN